MGLWASTVISTLDLYTLIGSVCTEFTCVQLVNIFCKYFLFVMCLNSYTSYLSATAHEIVDSPLHGENSAHACCVCTGCM